MLKTKETITAVVGGALLSLVLVAAACGSSSDSTFGPNGQSSGGASGGLEGFGDGGGVGPGGSTNNTNPCPPGLQCNVACSNGSTTSISGKVYDPAQNNPLYNITVFIPQNPLTPLPKGVPTGADACNCGALFKSGAYAAKATGVDGSFKIENAPVGTAVPLVIQVGKWRHQTTINVTPCTDNAQEDKSLSLPSTVAAGDTNDNIPDIAVSTGSADTLECLMKRIGLPDTEYVAGAGTTGHIHVFSGGKSGGGGGGGNPVGTTEKHVMAGAPTSSTGLWASQDQLMPYDILLLSCEGGETYNANPPALEAYLDAGGRAFASHFHYAWFSGPLSTTQSFTAPADWGNSLATWEEEGTEDNGTVPGDIQQTLNGSTTPFPKGVALAQWLANVKALGQGAGVGPNQLSIDEPRYNAKVSAANKPSQPWINHGSDTMYLSFDTPVNAPPGPGGAAPNYCGRAVFSDLHVGAASKDSSDTDPPPAACKAGELSPQEKALEFMLFDLSSCVVSDSVPPPTGLPVN